MNSIREIQFVNLDTGAPIFSVTGGNVQILLENSELIENIVELGGQANPNVLVVPLGDMGQGRQLLLANILKGYPVGKIGRNGRVTFYPLPPEEERNIARVVNERNGVVNRNADINLERQEAILETLRYLLIPESLIHQMILFEQERENEPIVSQEDTIEEMIEDHIKWLYTTGQKAKLTPVELEKAQAFFAGVEERYQQGQAEISTLLKNAARARRAQVFTRRRYNNNNNNNNYINHRHQEVEDEYRGYTDPDSYMPPGESLTGGMTTRQFERWLRTVYFKKAPLELNQLHLNTLYNENRRANRYRENRPRVSFYSNNAAKKPNNKKSNTKKNNKKKPNNNGNGTAW